MTEIVKRKLTFAELADLMEQSDAGLIDIDLEALGVEVRTKVDNICMVLKELEHREKFWRGEAAEAQKTARELANNQKRLKEMVLAICEKHNQDVVPGTKSKITVTNNSTAALVISEERPNPEYLSKYPGCVDLILVWKEDGIRERLEGGGELPFASLVRGKHLRITNHKGDLPKPQKQGQIDG